MTSVYRVEGIGKVEILEVNCQKIYSNKNNNNNNNNEGPEEMVLLKFIILSLNFFQIYISYN